ncbi:DUF21 domain-containing protein [Nymphaea thermarum]|nr:DUF21 domain-containing protein [Nymphaea thermarum]
MLLSNAIVLARMASRVAGEGGGGGGFLVVDAEDVPFWSFWWFVDAGISCLLVLFAGIMSGLTLGLMSLGLVDLEILQRSGTSLEKKQAGTSTPLLMLFHSSFLLLVFLLSVGFLRLIGTLLASFVEQWGVKLSIFFMWNNEKEMMSIMNVAAIFPVVQKQHQLLVTLLLCNAAAMEIIPQAICSRYGLAVGANFVGLVHILMIICYPIAYPIGKILDFLLGHNESALFRRAQLKALVSIHGKEAGKGGELTHDETTIISGALDLTEKTAEAAMTPIESTFSLDVNSKLDWEAMGKILARGHSRIPVYSGNPKNIIGLLLVKSLLTVRAETETPVSAVSIRRIPRVPADMPLYDILNEFQKGSSHMAAVIKTRAKARNPPTSGDGEKTRENKVSSTDFSLTSSLLQKQDENSEYFIDVEKGQDMSLLPKKCSYEQVDVAFNVESQFSTNIEGGEVIGIITLEDVFEELLQVMLTLLRFS